MPLTRKQKLKKEKARMQEGSSVGITSVPVAVDDPIQPISQSVTADAQIVEQVDVLEEGLRSLNSKLGDISSRSSEESNVMHSRLVSLEDQLANTMSLVNATKIASERASAKQPSQPVLCGKPQVFDGKDIENFLLTINNYTKLRDLDSANRIAVLVSYLGPALTTYRAWVFANPFGTYPDLLEHLRIVYGSQPNTLTAKVNFRHMKRGSDSFEVFLTKLEGAALLAYGARDITNVQSAVVEQFLLGLEQPKVQEVLMQEDHLNPIALLQKAQKVRDSIELATNSEAKLPVNAVLRDAPQIRAPQPLMRAKTSELRCWQCNLTGHRAFDCPQRRPTPQIQRPSSAPLCYHCKKPGHTWRMCPRGPGNAAPGMSSRSANPATYPVQRRY